MIMNKDIKFKDLKKDYDMGFEPSEDYLDSMPDIQNSPYISKYRINKVGIHNFKMPLKVVQKDGGSQEVMATITGTVSLEANKAGINMSRIIRTAYKSADDIFSIDKLCDVLTNYKKDLHSFDAHIIMKFPYRLWQEALKSKKDSGEPEGGWQYYDITFDVNLNKDGQFRKVMYIDYIYSSACPCSTALSEYAAYTRGVYGIPHSQRSVVKIGIEFEKLIWIEDIISKCRQAVPTETLVFCKRIDEMQFAILNGAQPKFVEDAARIFANMLDEMTDVIDYRLIISHLESLHDHNAIAVITKGIEGSKFDDEISYEDFNALIR